MEVNCVHSWLTCLYSYLLTLPCHATPPRCYLAGACREDGSIWALGGGSSLWQHAATYKSTEFLLPYDDDDGSNNTATGSSSNAPIEGDGNEMWETDDDDDDDDDDSDDGSNLHGGRGSGGGMRPPSPSPPPPPTCAQQWRPGPDMLVARCGHGAAVAHERGGALYAVGGYGGGLTYHSSAEVSHVCVHDLFLEYEGTEVYNLLWRRAVPFLSCTALQYFLS